MMSNQGLQRFSPLRPETVRQQNKPYLLKTSPLDTCTSKAYILAMLTFIELNPFASVRDNYLNDEEFALFQFYLSEHPDAGNVIPHSGGCRKI
jgi:hypothetical protein